MATFSPAFLDQIRRRISLSDIVGRYVQLQKRGSNTIACCPFHNEKSPSFYVYDTEGNYHCYGCKAHGDIFSFLMEKKGLQFPEAVEDLAGQAGIPMPRDVEMTPEDQMAREKRELYYEIMEKAALFYEKQLRSNVGVGAQRYIDGREIKSEIQKLYRLGYAPRGNVLCTYLKGLCYKIEDLISLGLIKKSTRNEAEYYDNFRDRLLFPICDLRGRVIAFGGRVLGAGEPKYLNSPETPLYHKSDIIYGYHQAKKHREKADPIICAEGYMDVIALHQGGFKGAVAPLGTAITEAQLRLMWRMDSEPIICLDGDAAGQRAANRVLETALPYLRSDNSLRFVTLPEGEDPDTMLRQNRYGNLKALYDNATPFVNRFWESLQEGISLETPEKKTAFRNKIYKLTGLIQDVSVKKGYEIELNDRIRILFRSQSQFSKFGVRRTYGASGKYSAGYVKPLSGPSPLGFSVNVPDVQTKILMACILNNPQILTEFESEFLEMPIDNKDMGALRDELATYLFEGEDLDKDALHNHLYGKGFKNTVESVCNWSIYTHANFAQPTEDLDAVRENWQRIWQFCHGKSALESDLEAVTILLEREPTAENFERLRGLQAELQKLRM